MDEKHVVNEVLMVVVFRTMPALCEWMTDCRQLTKTNRPPRGHPYRDTWIHCMLEVVHKSSIRSSQVRLQTVGVRNPKIQQTISKT